jgi:hypothetical protein
LMTQSGALLPNFGALQHALRAGYPDL